MGSGTLRSAGNRGLARRLRQHGRRSGVAVGLAMAATVAVFIVGTAVIFARLQPLVSDFITEFTPVPVASAGDAAPTPIVATGGSAAAPGRVAGQQTTPVPTAVPSPTPTAPVFAPDLQVNPAGTTSVRLRAEPSTAGGDATILADLAPGTALQATGRQEASADPAQPGVTWLEVRTAADQQGWIRQIDTVPNTP